VNQKWRFGNLLTPGRS